MSLHRRNRSFRQEWERVEWERVEVRRHGELCYASVYLHDTITGDTIYILNII
jgi:hypothetical protein